MQHIFTFFATGCYAGKLPFAPGTWGTAVGFGLYFVIGWLAPFTYAITALAFVFLSIWVSDHARKFYSIDDPPEIVIDEIAGFLVAMAFHEPRLIVALSGFVLFRIFDILKPPPIRWIERRFPGGVGIVLDDVAAGVYTNASLFALTAVASRFGASEISL